MRESPDGAREVRGGLAFVGLVLVAITVRDLGTPPYDDSYFFKRVALHFWNDGTLAWNVADGPRYGNTSLVFQGVVVVLTALFEDYVVLCSRLLAGLCLFGLGAVVLSWCARQTRVPRDGIVVGMYTMSTPLVLATAGTGMETALSLLFVGGALARMVGQRTINNAEAAGWTLLLYLTRPDAALLPLVVLLCRARREGRIPWGYLALLGIGLALIFAVTVSVFGSPLPSSFSVKTHGLSPYGEHMRGLGWWSKAEHSGLTLLAAAPLLLVAVRGSAPRTRALLSATLVFWGYHLVFTHEIMGYGGRFYAPGIIALAFAAASAWDERMNAVPWIARSSRVLVPLASGLWLFVAMAQPFQVRALSDEALVRAHTAEVTSFRGIFDVKRCLPELSTMYHSEVGVPGLLFPDARLVDLAGLQSESLFREPSTFDAACAADRPEALFLPHQNYASLNERIQTSKCLENYLRVVERSSSPLYVRADLAPRFLACAESEFVTPRPGSPVRAQ